MGVLQEWRAVCYKGSFCLGCTDTCYCASIQNNKIKNSEFLNKACTITNCTDYSFYSTSLILHCALPVPVPREKQSVTVYNFFFMGHK